MNQKIRINSIVALNGDEKIIGVVKGVKIDITNGQRVAIVKIAGSQAQPIPFSDLREVSVLESVGKAINRAFAAAIKLATAIQKQNETVRSNHGH